MVKRQKKSLRTTTKKTTSPNSRRRRRKARSIRPSHRQRPPRRLTARQQDTRNRALHALAEMRRGASLAAACRAQHIKPSTLRRYVGDQVRQDRPGGRMRVAATDAFKRVLRIPSPRGLVLAVAKGSKEAQLLSEYANAVAAYARRGDRSRLVRFEGKTFLTTTGERVPFLTDEERLDELAEAGLLQFDQLYATTSSGL